MIFLNFIIYFYFFQILSKNTFFWHGIRIYTCMGHGMNHKYSSGQCCLPRAIGCGARWLLWACFWRLLTSFCQLMFCWAAKKLLCANHCAYAACNGIQSIFVRMATTRFCSFRRVRVHLCKVDCKFHLVVVNARKFASAQLKICGVNASRFMSTCILRLVQAHAKHITRVLFTVQIRWVG